MKIWLMCSHLNSGGITRYVELLGKGLIGLGHQVTVIAATGDQNAIITAAGMKVHLLPRRYKSILNVGLYTNLSMLSDFIKTDRPDVIHAQTRVTQVLSVLLSRKFQIPLVTTCHGFFKPKLGRKLFPCWGDRVIAISPAVEKHLLKDLWVAKSQVVLITNGIETKAYDLITDTSRAWIRKQFGLEVNDFLFGCVARLSQVKGLDLAIQALAKMIKAGRKAKLVLFGTGPDESKLRRLVEKLSLQEHVYFFSFVVNAQETLTIFNCFVQPSRHEGLGLSVMEAQASGLPVIVSKVGGLALLVEHRKTGLLVEPENVDQLYEKMCYVMDHYEQSCKWGMKAREHILANYDYMTMASKTESIYQFVTQAMLAQANNKL